MNLLLQVISRQVRFGGDRRKVLAVVPSRADLSSNDDDTISTSVQVARTLQRRFDRGGDDLAPPRGIYIAHRTRSRFLVETTIALS